MKTKNMAAGKDLDLLIAKKVMKFTKAKYFKNGGGCYPADATPINDDPRKGWGTTSEGGTYPFFSIDCLFRSNEGGSGERWHPSTNIAQAFEVLEKLAEDYCDFSLERSGKDQWTATIPGWSVTAKTPELAICLVAVAIVS